MGGSKFNVKKMNWKMFLNVMKMYHPMLCSITRGWEGVKFPEKMLTNNDLHV